MLMRPYADRRSLEDPGHAQSGAQAHGGMG